jgi:hypothetical protein
VAFQQRHPSISFGSVRKDSKEHRPSDAEKMNYPAASCGDFTFMLSLVEEFLRFFSRIEISPSPIPFYAVLQIRREAVETLRIVTQD